MNIKIKKCPQNVWIYVSLIFENVRFMQGQKSVNGPNKMPINIVNNVKSEKKLIILLRGLL